MLKFSVHYQLLGSKTLVDLNRFKILTTRLKAHNKRTEKLIHNMFSLSSSTEPSLVVYSMSQEDNEMISLLTKRLIMYIGVQGSVESLLGAIFETYLR